MAQCPICGKEISNRVALWQHVCDDCIEDIEILEQVISREEAPTN